MTRRAAWPALLLLAVLAVPAVAQPIPSAKPAAPKPAVPKPAAGNQALDAIAAMVNDEPVLSSDVEEQLFMFLQRSQARPDSAQVDTLRRQVLDQLIDEKLLIAEAKRQGITVAPAEVNKQVEAAIDIPLLHLLEPDPVIEAYKRDVDRTLLRQNLARTPDERWQVITQALRVQEALRAAGAKARGR